MKIKLKSSIGVLGKSGETVTVGRNLAAGLIRRGQAEKVKPKPKKKKEQKDPVDTKQDKTDYETK